MGKADWHRLDNIGKYYSSQAGRWSQTVFRLAATLKAPVDPKQLQRALERTVIKHPEFNVSLRSGFFWHYLDFSDEVPTVRRENLPICFGVHTGPQSVLFRVSYFRNRVNLEVSHIISDGRGSLRFFQDLLLNYGQLAFGLDAADANEAKVTLADRVEDSFRRYYEKRRSHHSKHHRVYRLPGPRNSIEPVYMEYHLPADRVLDWAHKEGVSVTSLVIAAIICAIRDTMTGTRRGRTIRLDVPIDLRQFFDSKTMRNFYGLAYVNYRPGNKVESIGEVAKEVQRQLAEACTPESVKERMNRMIGLERNALLRSAPLFVKDLILYGANAAAGIEVTTSVSSLGRISLGPTVDSFVKSFSFLNGSSPAGLNFTLCTFENNLCIGISTRLINLQVLSYLCRIFSEEGIHGVIDSNLDKLEVARRLQEGQWLAPKEPAKEAAKATKETKDAPKVEPTKDAPQVPETENPMNDKQEEAHNA